MVAKPPSTVVIPLPSLAIDELAPLTQDKDSVRPKFVSHPQVVNTPLSLDNANCHSGQAPLYNSVMSLATMLATSLQKEHRDIQPGTGHLDPALDPSAQGLCSNSAKLYNCLEGPSQPTSPPSPPKYNLTPTPTQVPSTFPLKITSSPCQIITSLSTPSPQAQPKILPTLIINQPSPTPYLKRKNLDPEPTPIPKKPKFDKLLVETSVFASFVESFIPQMDATHQSKTVRAKKKNVAESPRILARCKKLVGNPMEAEDNCNLSPLSEVGLVRSPPSP